MNLIKFKDHIRPGDAYFNTYLKDQYAYWVRMRYVIPMSLITISDYINLERDIDLLKTLDPIYWDLQDPGDLSAYIDEAETNKVNDPTPFEHHNRYVCDPDITTAEVKKFRTWLADQLLKHRKNDWQEERVFKYYSNGMMDDTVRWYVDNQPKNILATPPCGCSSTTVINPRIREVASMPIGNCDPLSLYRNTIKNRMVELFGSIKFWQGLPLPLLKEVKIYLDHITRLGLKRTTGDEKFADGHASHFADGHASRFVDCCDKNTDSLDVTSISKAFEYLILDEVAGNRNFITNGLRTFSSIYESLYWG